MDLPSGLTDETFNREMGLMHITGEKDGPPVKVGVAVTDLTTGLYTSNSIMAALLGRIRTGRGQHIDASLSDCQVATLANIASSQLISGEKDSGRHGTAHRMLSCLQRSQGQSWRLIRDSEYHSIHRPLRSFSHIRWQRVDRRGQRSTIWDSV